MDQALVLASALCLAVLGDIHGEVVDLPGIRAGRQLYMERIFFAMPAIASFKLVILGAKGKKDRIKSFADLVGQVDIRTDSQALAYVRTVNRYGIWQHVAKNALLEVFSRDSVPKEAEPLIFKDWRKTFSGSWALLSNGDWAKCSLPAAKVQKERGGWRIHRICLARFPDWTLALVDSNETLSPNGDYRRNSTFFRTPNPGIEWFLMDREE